MPELQLQPPLAGDARSRAHLGLIERLGALDLSPILVYRIASLADSAVLAMAWQWDVLNPLLLPVFEVLVNQNFTSWDQILNVDTLVNLDQLLFELSATGSAPAPLHLAAYRSLILLSTQLHSTMGTVGALKQAFAGLGVPGAIIQEGQNRWGGTQYPPDQGWAVFRVLIDIASIPSGTNLVLMIRDVTALCNFWKPARCILDSVQFSFEISETLVPAINDFLVSAFVQRELLAPLPSDLFRGQFAPISESKQIVPYWNARYYHTGITYGQNEPEVADSGVTVNGTAIGPK